MILQTTTKKLINKSNLKFLLNPSTAKTIGLSSNAKHKFFKENVGPKFINYWKLMRADKPIGVLLLYWPCTWSIALSSSADFSHDLRLLALFGTGAFLMRSAGCIFNDLWDQDFDSFWVERTKNRPLASGEINEKEAVLLLAGLLTASLTILLQLNSLSVLVGASSLWLVVAYPLAKRFTNWPQLILGATFNWGALLGCTASTGKFLPEICIPLYLACICWTMVYDTIYAHQDKHDDILIGVKSTALRFGDRTIHWLSAFSLGTVGNLALVGWTANQFWPYYASLLAISIHFGWQIGTLQTESSNDCWNKFQSNQWVGGVVLSGILLSNLLKNDKERAQYEGEEKDELEMFMEEFEQKNTLNHNF